MYTGHVPRVSKIPVNAKVAEDIEENFFFLVSTLNNPREIKQFFFDFLTKEEKIMLAKRLTLHLMLEQGYKQSEIQSLVRMSRESIRTHQSVWSRGSKTYKTILQKLVKHAKGKEFWTRVEKTIRPVALFMNAQSDMKSRGKVLSGEYD